MAKVAATGLKHNLQIMHRLAMVYLPNHTRALCMGMNYTLADAKFGNKHAFMTISNA